MALPLPKGAQPILDARMKGKRPADMVIVSLVEPLATNNPVVYVVDGQRYDWRWVRGLDVCLYVTNEDNWPDLVKDIALCWPQNLELWNHVERWGTHIYLVPTPDDVHKPRKAWKFDLAFVLWLDFQNLDFIERHRYARDENGMPYGI